MISPILFVHGFNLKPDRMKYLAHQFSDRETVCVILPGHSGEETKGIKLSDWIDHLRFEIKRHSELSPTKDVSIVGFSLGALITSLLLSEDSEVQIDRFYALTPGFWPKRWKLYRMIAKSLSLLPVNLPSFTSKDYRANDTVHASMYWALFEGARIIQNPPSAKNFENVKGRVLLHPNDELVSSKKITEWTKRFTPWDVDSELLKNCKAPWNHMLIDRWCMGERDFEILVADMKSFLGV